MAEFSATQGVEQQQAGVAAAAAHRAYILSKARLAAKILGQTGRTVTADDVYTMLYNGGYNISELGPAAGAIFRGKNWKFTGEWRQSNRTSNHARLNRVWQYVGE